VVFEGLYSVQAWLIISSMTPSRVAQMCMVRKDVSRFHSYITGNLSRQVQRPGIQPSPPSGWSSYGRRSAIKVGQTTRGEAGRSVGVLSSCVAVAVTKVHQVQRRAFMLLSQRVGVLACFDQSKTFLFYDPRISRSPTF